MYGTMFMTMTPEEKKTFFIMLGISLLVLAIYGIYYYFKHKNDE